MHPAVNELRKAIVGNSGSGKGGIFGFFQSAINPREASSDEESSTAEDDEFIRNGTRGIIVSKCFCLKTERMKTFHLHLYSGSIYQYTDGRRKVQHCADISNILVRNDHVVVLDMKRRGMAVAQKRYAFSDEECARKYQKYIDFRNDTGQVVRASFDAIDRRGVKLITIGTLQQALRTVDLDVNDDDTKIMLLLNNGNGEYYDFQDFVAVFIDTQVSSLRECLQEWLYQARELLKPRPRVLPLPLHQQVTIHPSDDGDQKSGSDNDHEEGKREEGSILEGKSEISTVQPHISPPLPPSNLLPVGPAVPVDTSVLSMIRLVPGESIAHVVDRVRWCLHMVATNPHFLCLSCINPAHVSILPMHLQLSCTSLSPCSCNYPSHTSTPLTLPLAQGKSSGGPWPYPGCLVVTNYRLVLLSPGKVPLMIETHHDGGSGSGSSSGSSSSGSGDGQGGNPNKKHSR